MPLPQTINQFQQPGARGLIAHAETRNLISRSLVAGGGALLFDNPVFRGGTTADACSADPAAGDFLGLARRTGVLDPANTVDTFAVADEVPILTQGDMWVLTNGAVVIGVPANFNTTTRLWTATAAGGAVIAVPGVEFDSNTSAAGLALVRVQRIVPA